MMDAPNDPTGPDGPDLHAETRILLPWLANGSLAGAELERVRAHLGECPACRAQLEWERGMAAGGDPAPRMSAQQAFARLRPQLGPQELPNSPARWLRLAAANDPRWLRSVALVQLGLILVLGLVAVRPGPEQGLYHTLGARQAALQGNIVVSFEPSTPERELRRILQASGARLVDGPTAADAYVLSVAPGEAAPALQRLRSEPAVTLAEALNIIEAQ
jgi:anti-sigma factor RsiW